MTELANACFRGHEEEVKSLLAAGGVDVEEPTGNYGNTPLMLASEAHHPAIVQLLLAHGADVNNCNDDEETALDTAVELGFLDTVQILLEAGAGGKAQALAIAQRDGHKHLIPLLEEEKEAQ